VEGENEARRGEKWREEARRGEKRRDEARRSEKRREQRTRGENTEIFNDRKYGVNRFLPDKFTIVDDYSILVREISMIV